MTIKQRYEHVIKWFQQEMPVAETELHYDSAFHLLVAVILSAQCTDKRVNMITPALFEAYPTAEDMAKASSEEIFSYIRSCSYPNNKTKSLMGMSRKLVEDFGGVVPDDLDKLMTLPGVGRKTANVMLAVEFAKPAIAVDTHVFRVSDRLGLTTGCKTPLQTEQTLTKHIPTELLSTAHHWLILHGRYVCKARRPDCLNCGIREACRYFNQTK
jgi:endonuclease-3